VGAIYAAALGIYKKYGPRPRTRKGINLLYFGCDFSGWYNFGKIVKIVATRCPILKLKCNKFDFGWGYAPDPAAGAYSAPYSTYLDFRGPTSKILQAGCPSCRPTNSVKALKANNRL